MTEANQNPEIVDAENASTEPTTMEEWQARAAELEGMLQDEKLRGLANEQNLRRRHQEELQAAHKF
ncbi:nucleotide exchange factor GrpE, partial [Kingella kingae]|nr:nucleotide exchange factor GrpE [Kingella kingae]